MCLYYFSPVCPAFTSPLGLWPCFPCRQRESGHSWLLLTWADTWSWSSRWGPGPSPQRHFPHWNRIPTFVMLSGVFTPILPKPIEEREKIQLLLMSNRLSFQGANLKMCHGYALQIQVVWVGGTEQERWVVMTGCQLAVASNRRVSERWTKEGEAGGYSFITKEGQRDNHWLWKYVCLR